MKGNTAAKSGAQIVENTGKKKPEEKVAKREVKKPDGNKGSLEHRFDYVCNFLNIKKEQAKEQTSLDLVLDDICKMDFVVHFVNIKELILISQSITQIEGLDRLKFVEKLWLT